jgi:hypothetical protein
MKEAGRAMTKAFTGAVQPAVEHYMASHFNSQQQMLDYIDKVKEEMENPNYHFYVTMYYNLLFASC